MRIIRRPGFVPGLLVSVVATGSFPVAARSAPAAIPSACSVLTPAQVGAALGVTVGTGAPLTPNHTEMCTWTATEATHKGTRASLTFIVPLGSRTPTQRFDTGKTPIPNMTKTPVAGLGDDAYVTTLKTAGATLSVRKGDTAFEVHVTGFSDAESEAKEKALAKAVLATL